MSEHEGTPDGEDDFAKRLLDRKGAIDRNLDLGFDDREDDKAARERRWKAEGERFKREMSELAGGLLSIAEVMELHSYETREDVQDAVRERRLLAVDDAGEAKFPACQFNDSGVLPGIRLILEAAPLTASEPWRILQYLLVPEFGMAGRRALDLISTGEPHDLEIALAFANRMDR